MAPR
jgi:hypothetical protein